MRASSTLMVIGGSYDQLPMIRKAEELGYRTLVVDCNEDAPGISSADEALVIDTSDLDAVTAAARRHQIAGICTMATNCGPRTVAHVAGQLGLPAISALAADSATDKSAMKACCVAAGIPVAVGETCDTMEAALSVAQKHGFPLLLKASDASGCRGIEPAHADIDIRLRFKCALQESRTGLVVVERYYPDARVIGAESLITAGGGTKLILAAEKIVRTEPCISTAGVNVPAELGVEETEQLKAKLNSLHQALGLDMGASHVDLVKVEDEWLVIDVGPRLGGGPMIHYLAPALTGVDMVEFVVRQALGEALLPAPHAISAIGIERFFYSPVEGHLAHVELPDVPADVRLQWRKPVGSYMHPGGPNVDRLGFISLIAPDLISAENRVAEIAAQIKLEIQLADTTIHKASPNILAAELEK